MSERLLIPFHRPSIDQAEIDAVVDALQSGWLTTGPRTAQFETEFSEYVGAPYALALNSGTAALHLALLSFLLGLLGLLAAEWLTRRVRLVVGR